MYCSRGDIFIFLHKFTNRRKGRSLKSQLYFYYRINQVNVLHHVFFFFLVFLNFFYKKKQSHNLNGDKRKDVINSLIRNGLRNKTNTQIDRTKNTKWKNSGMFLEVSLMRDRLFPTTETQHPEHVHKSLFFSYVVSAWLIATPQHIIPYLLCTCVV